MEDRQAPDHLNHEMPFAETWGRGLMAPDPSVLVRAGKKPDDALYAMEA